MAERMEGRTAVIVRIVLVSSRQDIENEMPADVDGKTEIASTGTTAQTTEREKQKDDDVVKEVENEVKEKGVSANTKIMEKHTSQTGDTQEREKEKTENITEHIITSQDETQAPGDETEEEVEETGPTTK